MHDSAFRALFLAVFGSGMALETILDLLNRREVLRHRAPPPFFTGPGSGTLSESAGFDAETFAKSRAYTLDRLAFGQFSRFYSAAILLGLLFSGILPFSDRLLERVFGDGLHRGALFLAGITLAQSLLKVPLSVYSTFRIEGRHGFNTMTWPLFRRDLIKEMLLSLALGLPLLYALLALMRALGERWWLGAFALLLAFQLAMMILYPTFLAPLFNRFRPLEEGVLKTSLLELAHRLRFPAGGIYVMDGSRRSLHSNAYFTGFGRFRRIVLFDTLLRQMEHPELLSVLAHEIGHYKRRHIYKMMFVQTALMGLVLWLASLALRWPTLYQAFGFAASPLSAGPFAGNPGVGLFLFLTAISALSLPLAPLQNAFSRKHEYEADAFAVEAIRDPGAMQSALIKLSRENLSNMTPHPWYSAFHYSHPTLRERLRAIQGPANA